MLVCDAVGRRGGRSCYGTALSSKLGQDGMGMGAGVPVDSFSLLCSPLTEYKPEVDAGLTIPVPIVASSNDSATTVRGKLWLAYPPWSDRLDVEGLHACLVARMLVVFSVVHGLTFSSSKCRSRGERSTCWPCQAMLSLGTPEHGERRAVDLALKGRNKIWWFFGLPTSTRKWTARFEYIEGGKSDD